MKVLEVKNLKKYYVARKGIFSKEKTTVKAVDGVSFSIGEGEVFALVGKSGSGKSTIAKLILKLEERSGGEIIYRGRSIDEIPLKELRKEIQIIFQDPNSALDPRFRAGEAIEEALIIDGVKNESERKERVYMLLRAVGLGEDFYDKYPHELSGGEKQRICIARALAKEPKFIIADEAVSALDAYVRYQILELFLDLRKRFNLTYLFITHDLRVVKKIADRVAIIDNGKIAEIGEKKEIFSNPKSREAKLLLSSAYEAS